MAATRSATSLRDLVLRDGSLAAWYEFGEGGAETAWDGVAA